MGIGNLDKLFHRLEALPPSQYSETKEPTAISRAGKVSTAGGYILRKGYKAGDVLEFSRVAEAFDSSDRQEINLLLDMGSKRGLTLKELPDGKYELVSFDQERYANISNFKYTAEYVRSLAHILKKGLKEKDDFISNDVKNILQATSGEVQNIISYLIKQGYVIAEGKAAIGGRINKIYRLNKNFNGKTARKPQ